MAEEGVTEQEKMDRMVAALSPEMEGGEEKGPPEGPEPGDLAAKAGEDGTPNSTGSEAQREEEKKAASLADDSGGALSEETRPETDGDDADHGPRDGEGGESGQELDRWDEPGYADEEKGKVRSQRGIVIWLLVALVLGAGAFAAWFFLHGDRPETPRPALTNRVRKVMPEPAPVDSGGQPEAGKGRGAAARVMVRRSQAPLSEGETAVVDDHDDSSALQRKMEQILEIRDRLAEKRARAVMICEKLKGQIDALGGEIMAEKKALGIGSWKEASRSPRIYYNIKLIQLLLGYISKLHERIRFYEDGYARAGFCYEEAADDLKIMGLLDQSRIRKIMARMDKVVDRYRAIDRPEMFSNDAVVLESPRKVWKRIMASTGRG